MQECKRELAKSVVQPISMEHLQRDLDNARAENQTLKERLRAWESFYAGRGVTLSNLVLTGTNPAARVTPKAVAASSEVSANTAHATPVVRPAPPPTATRVHTIVAGETPAVIARRYNIKLSALQSANPSMDAKRLRPGQTLVIPPP